MNSIVADMHTHTIGCDHAYSTITENAAAAKEKGLSFLGITEHAPNIIGGATLWFFQNLRILPRFLSGVMLLKGVELNIMDKEGVVDLPAETLQKLDWVIASMHTPCFTPAGVSEHTSAWMAVAENPNIDVIGHSGDERYSFDYESVIPIFGKYNKIVEINSHSFQVRPNSHVNCARIARLCAKHGVRVVVNSDAHFHTYIGQFDAALQMLKEAERNRIPSGIDCQRRL